MVGYTCQGQATKVMINTRKLRLQNFYNIAQVYYLRVRLEPAREESTYRRLLDVLKYYISNIEKGLPGTNTLDYSTSSASDEDKFLTSTPGPNDIKLFLSVIYEFL